MSLPALRKSYGLGALLALLTLPGCTGPQNSSPAATTPVALTTPSSAPLFKEVTQDAGIQYAWHVERTVKHLQNGSTSDALSILETIGNGCAFLDYDNDGNLDILLVGPKLALYKGDGHGHFTDVTHETGLDKLQGHFLGCAVGDYDNDGYDDIYITAYRGGVLLHNEAGKGFKDVTTAAGIQPQKWGTSASFVDVDGDGKLDLFIGNYAKFGPKESQLCEGTGGKGMYTACGPRFYGEEHGVLYRNMGTGKFADVTARWMMGSGKPLSSGKVLGVAAADFAGKGRQSIALANDERPGDLLFNQSHTFENINIKSGTAYDSHGNVHGGMGIDWGDYDNDGKLDLVVATFQHEAKNVYHNDGDFFSETSAPLGLAEKTLPYVAFGIKFLDYDNDGFLDLAIANGHVQDNIGEIDKTTTYKQKPQLFHNVGGTAFEEVSDKGGSAFQKLIVGRGLAVGDFDNDGKMDLLYVDSEGAPLLLHNEVPNAGHWLLCKLVGTKSNHDGIGALITAEAGDKKLLRRCATDGSYMSASDKRVHFGLGAATKATLTVQWPSGHKDVYTDVPADKIVTLTEGKSQAE